MIYRFVPGFGDEIQGARTNRKQATDGSQAAAMISSPAALVSQGIKTHSGRGGQNSGDSGSGGARPANPVSGGVAAHSSRNSGSGGAAAWRIPRRTPAPQRLGPDLRHPARQPHPRGGGSGSSGNKSTGGGGR